MRISLVAASSNNGVIGDCGGIPWRAKGEQGRFKAATMGGVVVMGRKTYETLPRPLDGRDIIILSRSLRSAEKNIARSIEEAVRMAQAMGAMEVFIGGGAEVYAQAMPLADIIYHSIVDTYVEGDTTMPAIDTRFVEIWSKDVQGAPGYTYRTLVAPNLVGSSVDDTFGIVAEVG